MAGASLLTLLDDIATVLDDVALMSKMAAKKTAGVLGDDLALNAQQVSGVAAEREIPVVWAVAKGSFRNKLILVPAALLMSSLIPWLIMPLLLLGGLFLCFEGAEKILEKFFHSHNSHQPSSDEAELGSTSIEEYEKCKIAGAIRTDFILSAEIIVIALGTVQGHDMITQILVVSLIAVIMTIGVYGLVAAIVKLDDLGFYLERISNGSGLKFRLGKGLISFAPNLMKGLTIVGTAAMFLVGGGIVVHNVPWVHHALEPIVSALPNLSLLTALIPVVLNGVVGLLAGLAVVVVWSIANQLRPSR
ncbi:membrane protein [Vibrio alginolyticus]|nr:membrane protein [Vibrio alginolyticus]